MAVFDLHSCELPPNYKTVLVENTADEYTLRADLKNENETSTWVYKFGELTQTQWILRRSRYGVQNASKEFLCHHSSFRKVKTDETTGFNRKGISKNVDCLARIKISINTVGSKRSRDSFVRIGLWATIRITKQHSHPLKTAKTLRFLQDQSGTLREIFFEYFHDNMTASEAKRFHERQLRLKKVTEVELADGSQNPTCHTVSYWFKQWRSLNLRPRAGEELIKKLEDKKEIYSEHGIVIQYTAAPFCVLILTPIMLRAHKLSSSANLAFVDTTSTSDAGAHSITFIWTPCPAGAVPLAVLITNGQNEESYSNAFNLLKSALPEAFGSRGFPSTAFTDDAAAEITAVKNIWPGTKHLLCIFRVLQAVWRWLWNSNNKIKLDDKIQLMYSFKKIMYADMVQIEKMYNDSLRCGAKNPKWITYMGEYWKCKEKWVLAYRNEDISGHHTNYFAETTIRIFKDVILSRVKAYNVITLVDIMSTTLEDYFSEKLLNFSNFHDRCSFLFFQRNLKEVSYLSADDIVEIGEYSYSVPSEKKDESYFVDSQVGSCTCPDGKSGTFCTHQSAIYQHFSTLSANFPQITKEARYEIARVAFGENVPDISFYDDFKSTPVRSPGIVEVGGDSPVSPLAVVTTEYILPVEHVEAVDSGPSSYEDLKHEELIHFIVATLEEKLRSYCTPKNNSDLEKFYKTLQNISTAEACNNFLHTVPTLMRRFENGTRIEVTPTSFSRQKALMTISACRVTKEYAHKKFAKCPNLLKMTSLTNFNLLISTLLLKIPNFSAIRCFLFSSVIF